MSGGSKGGCDGCYEDLRSNNGKTIYVKPDNSRFLAQMPDGSGKWSCFPDLNLFNLPIDATGSLERSTY